MDHLKCSVVDVSQVQGGQEEESCTHGGQDSSALRFVQPLRGKGDGQLWASGRAVPGHVIHAAGGDTVGSTFEPGALNSTVRGGQAGDVAKTTKLVPMITVDSLVQKYSIPSISLIRINTEGHDPAVLRGASWVLGHKMASVVEFEYHFKGMWTRTKLSAVMSQMKEYGYDCFWQSNAGWLSPFFAQCDHEFHSLWNSNSGIHNVVCAHDHRILRTFSMLVPRGLRNVTRGLRNVTRGLRNVTRGGLRSSR